MSAPSMGYPSKVSPNTGYRVPPPLRLDQGYQPEGCMHGEQLDVPLEPVLVFGVVEGEGMLIPICAQLHYAKINGPKYAFSGIFACGDL